MPERMKRNRCIRPTSCRSKSRTSGRGNPRRRDPNPRTDGRCRGIGPIPAPYGGTGGCEELDGFRSARRFTGSRGGRIRRKRAVDPEHDRVPRIRGTSDPVPLSWGLLGCAEDRQRKLIPFAPAAAACERDGPAEIGVLSTGALSARVRIPRLLTRENRRARFLNSAHDPSDAFGRIGISLHGFSRPDPPVGRSSPGDSRRPAGRRGITRPRGIAGSSDFR